VIGERVFTDRFGKLRLPEGGFGRDLRGQWWVRPPGEDSLKVDGKSVVEHTDGTITVYAGINGHGLLLEHGVWKLEKERPQ
jgi:hypothetical protein